MDVVLQEAHGASVESGAVEIVERKGKGHPDTICDGVMEAISCALAAEYQRRLGGPAHYNCDKALLVAGEVERRFGGGRVTEPMRLIIGDRATFVVDDQRIDIDGVVVEAADRYLSYCLRDFDPEKHIRYQNELKPGSEQLTGIFRRASSATLGANDTSAAVGYAPLSETEQLVLDTELYVNSSEFKTRFPETGEDVKVMGVRRQRHLQLTVAMPLLDRYVGSVDDYFEKKTTVEQAILRYVGERTESIHELTVRLNVLDAKGAGLRGLYLSVLGTSAEDADSGQVGRGNQVNGVIALNRPGQSEAAAGKNPVSHVGKIYSVLAHVLAERLYESLEEVEAATVWLSSEIGRPVTCPVVAAAEVRLQPGATLADVHSSIVAIIESQFSDMANFCLELMRGRYGVY